MADTTTTNLSLTKPELDVSTNWGQKLNANLDALDAIFSATGTGVSLNIDGGDIASAVTINKSPVITLGGDLTGSVTLTNLASGTLTATIAGTSVENSMLAGSIANSKLSNSSITVGAGASASAISLGGTINFAGTSNEVEVAESSGTITIGLPAATEITTSLGVGGGSTNGVQISQGAIAIKNGGTQSYIDFYCESSNAHYARLQAPAHANFGGNITLTLPATTGTLALTSGDITGNAATATALATARTIQGVSFDGTANVDLTESIQDVVGAMVSGNTESNITVTYDDSDGTLDFSVTGGGSVSEAFKTISVSGQSDVVADAAADTLTLVAGSNMTITTNSSGDTITFASSGSGGSQNLFSTIAVSGQSNVVADSTTDTLTLAAGNNVTITTDASTDTITINATSSGGGGGGSSTQFAKNTFTGDDSTTDFTLTQSMTSEDGLIVFIDGVYQADNVYSVSGQTLSFATAPLASRVIEVFQLEGGIVGSAPVVDTMTGDGSDTTLTLSITPISENQTFVTFDGVVQHKGSYSLSNNVITFGTAPPTGVAVECITFNNVTAATDSVVDTFTGTGSQTAFTLSRQPLTENNTLVYVSGIYQDKSTYSISSSTLNFSTAPANGVSIEVVSAVAAITNSATLLVDADSDTKIQVEESTDEDKIKFDTAGTERMVVGSDGKIGIGIEATEGQLHVKSDSSGEVELLTLENSTGTNGIATLTLKTTSTDSTKSAQIAAKRVNASGHTDLIFRTYNGSVGNNVTIDHDGVVSMPKQPAFHADYDGTASITDNNTVSFPNVRLNVGSCYSTSTGKFTAPVAGNYLIYWDAIGGNDADVYRFKLYKNDAQYLDAVQLRIDTESGEYGNGTKVEIVPLAASDTLKIFFDSDSGNVAYADQNYITFGGFLIG